MKESEEYKECPISHACYMQCKGNWKGIDCFNSVCLMKHNPDQCKKYFEKKNENI